jgi:hypothetical protein
LTEHRRSECVDDAGGVEALVPEEEGAVVLSFPNEKIEVILLE